MCGIIGIYDMLGITREDLEEFTRMLVECERRGTSATGVFNQHLNFVKGPFPSHQFVQSGGYSRWKEKSIGSKWIAGHCRNASHGNPIYNVNNHPVYHVETGSPRFLLVHNGNIRSLEYPVPWGIVDTMSAWLAIDPYFNGKNLMKASAAGLSFISGDGTFAIGSDKQLVLSKLDNRPLFVKESGIRVSFASEWEMIGGKQEDFRMFPLMTAWCIDVNGKRSETKIVSKLYSVADRIEIHEPPKSLVPCNKTPVSIDAISLKLPVVQNRELVGFKPFDNARSPFRRMIDGFEKCRTCQNYSATESWCDDLEIYVFPGLEAEENEHCHYIESTYSSKYWNKENYDRFKTSIGFDLSKNEKKADDYGRKSGKDGKFRN